MKQLLLLAGCAVILSALAGCQKADRGVDVIIEGGGPFPKSLAGTWKADKRRWEFVFQPDGTISSAVIDSGMVTVTPSRGIATLETEKGKGVYKLGKWIVQYSPHDRELAVKVVVDSYHLDMKTFAMKGHSTDWFVGPVSEDSRTWEAEWFTFPKAIAFAQGQDDLVFDQDPNDNPIDTLVFTKQKKTN